MSKFRKLCLSFLPCVSIFSVVALSARAEQLPYEWREKTVEKKEIYGEFEDRTRYNDFNILDEEHFFQENNENHRYLGGRLRFISGRLLKNEEQSSQYGGSSHKWFEGFTLQGQFDVHQAEKAIGSENWNKFINESKFTGVDYVNIQFINDSFKYEIIESGGLGFYNYEEKPDEYERNAYEELFDHEFYNFSTIKIWATGDVINNEKVEKTNIYNRWWNEALNSVDNVITISSDTGGNLTTRADEGTTQRSNISYLDDEIGRINKKLADRGNKLQISYRINSNDSNKESIDVLVRDTSENGYQGIKLLKSDVKIKFRYTDYLEKAELDKRLKIQLGKYLDYENYSTQLVDDKLVRYPGDEINKLGVNGNKYYAGKWIAHTPLSVSFNTTFDENEVVFVNGKKIDVLDQKFNEKLTDNRKDANDNERVLNFGENNKTKDDNNSHKKNEYKIKIIQYEKDKEHIERNIKQIYEKILVIDSRSLKMDFKWYAWDPENNEHQKLLIEKYVKNESGEYKKDANGNFIDNPLYDASIDPHTGTKKQLVWFNLDVFNDEETTFFNEDLREDELQFNFGSKGLSEDISDYYEVPENQRKYYEDTNLPFKSQTLFKPKNLGRGFIAEAVVLGKGGLRELIGEAENFRYIELKKVNGAKYKDLLKYSANDEGVPEDWNLNTKTTDTDYFSTSGIWLFWSNTKNSISNFKIVLIEEPGQGKNDINNPPNSYFTDSVVLDSGQIEPLWQTKDGVAFFNYLISVGLSKQEILKLNYEDAMEHYKQYIEKLYYDFTFNDYITIDPVLKSVADDRYTVDEFKSRFADVKYAESELLGEFSNKDKVNIDKVEVADDNSGAYISFKLKTFNDVYKLRQDRVFLKIKFKNIARTDKKIINLKLNRQYFIDTARGSYIDKYVDAIVQNQKMWFNDLVDDDFKLLNFKLEFSRTTKLLTIRVSLRNDDGKTIIVPDKVFYIALSKFKSDGAGEFEKPNYNKPEIDSNGNSTGPGGGAGGKNGSGSHSGGSKTRPGGGVDNNSITRDIFENIKLNTISLNGLDNVDEIKKFIISEISKQLKGLKYDEDYEIKNLNTVAEELSVPQIRPSDVKYIHNAILSIVAKKGRGVIYARVNNVVDNVFNSVINLENIKIGDYVFDESKFENIEKRLIEYATLELAKHNLVLGKDVQISNIDNAVRNLAKGKGVKQIVVIQGINRKIINLTSFVAINNAKEVRDKNGDLYLFDLGFIQTREFSYSENILSRLRQNIINDIDKYLRDKYELKYGVDWYIDINKLNEVIRESLRIKNETKLFKVRINAVDGVSKNYAEFNIKNIINEKIIDDLDDVNVVLPKDDAVSQQIKERNKKILIGVLVPLGVITLGVAIILGWLIKVRHFDKKIK